MVGPLPVLRYLPALSQQMVGPFIFLDRAGPAQVPTDYSGGVPEHPHAGLSTFTYLLSGKVQHTDSAGHSARIEAGDIALMSAGTGITHSEMNVPDPNAETATISLVQLWLALPDEFEDMEPTFEHVPSGELPCVEFDGWRTKLGIGAAWDVEAPTTAHANSIFAEIEIDPGGSATIPADWDERALLVLGGSVDIEGTHSLVDTFAVLTGGAETKLHSKEGAWLALLGGNTFPSERFIAASFVASSQAKLQSYMDNYRSGNFPSIQQSGA